MAVAGIHRPAPAPPAESPTIIPPTPPPGSSSVRRPAAAGASAAAKSTYSSPGGKRRQLPPTPPGARAPPLIFIPQPQQQQPQQPMPSVLPHTMLNGFAGNGPVRGLQRGIQRQEKVDLPSDIRQDYYPTDQFRFAAPDAYAQLGMHHAANAAPGGSFDFDEQNAFDDLNDEDYFDDEFTDCQANRLDYEDYFWSHRSRDQFEATSPYGGYTSCNSFKMEKIHQPRSHSRRHTSRSSAAGFATYRPRNSGAAGSSGGVGHRVPKRIVYSYAPV